MSDRAMAQPQKADTKQLAREQRRARLAAELRSNLRKRKEQARVREPLAAPAPGHATGQPDAKETANAHDVGPTGEVA
jgi:hypothetical protein